MTRATEPQEPCRLTAAELDRRVACFVRDCELLDLVVTHRLEVEPAGAARLCDVSVETLRNWRSDLAGPPHVNRGKAQRPFYPIRELIEWAHSLADDGSVMDLSASASASSAS